MTAPLVAVHTRQPWIIPNDPEKWERYPLVVRAESIRGARHTKGQLWERVAEGKTR